MHRPETPGSRVTIEIAPRTIVLLLGVVAGIWLLGQLATVLAILIVALVLVGTFDPIVSWLERRGVRRGRALVLVFVAATLALAAVVLLMVPPLFQQLIQLIDHAPKDRERMVRTLAGYSWTKPLITAIQDLPLDKLGTRTGVAMIGYSTRLLEVIGYGISTLVLAIYLLADPPRSKGLIYALVPRHHHVKLAKILVELKVIVGGYMRGQFITSLSIAVFVFALLTLLGADNALAIALFAGLTDIIPFIGGYIASTPAVIAVSPQGATVTLVVLGVMVLYQEFESRILVPRVYGRALRLPPAVVLGALLVGGTLAGILGALLALPIAAGLQMVIRELHVDLPGEAPAPSASHEQAERASQAYEQLAEGVPARDAAIIADALASIEHHREASQADLLSAPAAPSPAEPRPRDAIPLQSGRVRLWRRLHRRAAPP